MDSKTTNILIGVVAVIVLGAAFMFSGGAGTTSTGLVAESPTGGSEISAFIRQISAIKTISLTKGVFDNRVLLNLKDQSREIKAEPLGRPNPFAPISGSRQSASLQQVAAPANTQIQQSAPAESKPLAD